MCKNSAEIQSAHFGRSNEQATLHTGVIYHVDGLQSFTSISDSLRHYPAAVWAHLQLVLSDLKLNHPEITDIHFYSDGPVTQYCNKLNFYLRTTILHDWGFQTGSWNFFSAGHGKGAPDAIGGAVKRQADQLVLSGIDLPDAMKLFNFLSSQQSATKFYFTDAASITQIDSRCHRSLRAINGTMKLHQIQTDATLKLVYHDLSCYCQRPTFCSCYGLRK